MTTSVTSASASGSLTSTATGGSNAALNDVNFDTFLKLLVAQLKNQDPLNPMDGTEFTGQIAQFSSLEQQINGNNLLKQIAGQRDYGQLNEGAGYIGKDVLVPGGVGQSFTTTSEGALIGFKTEPTSINKAVREVTLNITNAAGDKVFTQTFTGSDVANSTMPVRWDGKDSKGNTLPVGSYRIFAEATDVDGKRVPAKPLTTARVESVLSESDGVALSTADGRLVRLNDLVAVTAAKTPQVAAQ
jgi:flagellar basal-body rod modification protein FlgD